NGTPGHCDVNCTPPGCGNGVIDPGEQCDDGNTTSCDGCSSTCQSEVGWQCGDGIVNAACGEECDPPTNAPPGCSYLCQVGTPPPLGTRHFAFGGALYSSALGPSVPLGVPSGAFDLVAGTPGIGGVAPVSVAGPVFYTVPILGGSFGYLCVRVSGCTGIVDCKGDTPVGVRLGQGSAGRGVQTSPTMLTTGLGARGGRGAVLLTCEQSVVQTSPPAPDCSTQGYPPDQMTAYTTGSAEGAFINADARIGTGEIAVSGENFQCAAWTAQHGLGQLAGPFLQETAPQAPAPPHPPRP